MNGAEMLWAALMALWAVSVEGFAAYPLLMSALLALLFSFTVAIWRLLDRKGWQAAGWGACAAAAFAVVAVLL